MPLAEKLGLPLKRGARVEVDRFLRVPGYDKLFVAGDLAASEEDAPGCSALAARI